VVHHLLEASLPQCQQLRDHADVLLRHVDGEALDGLVHLAVDLARDDHGLADGELEALAAHQLDEHRELQLPAPLHLPRVGSLGGEHPQRDVADDLLLEPSLDQPRGQPVAVLTGQRRRVDPDRHCEARLVDADHRQRARVVRIGERLADGDLRYAGDGDQLARARLRRVDAVKRLGDVKLGHLCPLDAAVDAAPRDLLALADRPLAHTAEGQPANVRRGVEVGHVRL